MPLCQRRNCACCNADAGELVCAICTEDQGAFCSPDCYRQHWLAEHSGRTGPDASASRCDPALLRRMFLCCVSSCSLGGAASGPSRAPRCVDNHTTARLGALGLIPRHYECQLRYAYHWRACDGAARLCGAGVNAMSSCAMAPTARARREHVFHGIRMHSGDSALFI